MDGIPFKRTLQILLGIVVGFSLHLDGYSLGPGRTQASLDCKSVHLGRMMHICVPEAHCDQTLGYPLIRQENELVRVPGQAEGDSQRIPAESSPKRIPHRGLSIQTM